MIDEILMENSKAVEDYYNELCRGYGVSCKVLSKKKYAFLEQKEHYLVLGINGVPEDLDVKEIYFRQERTFNVFYTKYFVIKLDEDIDKLSLVGTAVSYCQTAEFLKRMYSQYGVPMPEKIRGDEIRGLKEYNSGRKNPVLPMEAIAEWEAGLSKFFKQEKSRSKFSKNWREFIRSDKFDTKASRMKMLFDFYKRNRQITTVDLLIEATGHIKTTVISEHELKKFKEEMKKLYPEVLYAISKKEINNHGFDVKRNKNKPIHKIKSGPFGKLVTYQAYCEEREKRFATESYEAIKDLNPAYYVTRDLYYKAVDEPFIASVLNSIHFAFAKSDSLQTVSVPGLQVVSYLDVPVDDMMNFVSLAKANKVPFYMDYYGKFSTPNLDKVRVIYSSSKNSIMSGIVSRMINEKFDLSHITTSLDRKSPPLKKQHPIHPELTKDNNIEL